MATKRIIDLVENNSPDPGSYFAIDNSSPNATERTRIQDALAIGGVGVFATAAQGELADTAIQPAVLATVAPAIVANTLLIDNAAGTARQTKTFDEANAALGLTYIKDYGSHTIPLRKFRSTYTDPSNWDAPLQAAANSGEPCIRVHADDETTYQTPLIIPFSSTGQKWVGEGMDNKSLLRKTTDVDEPGIIVRAERSGFRFIGLKGVDYTSGSGGPVKTRLNAAIFVERTDLQDAETEPRVDLDFEFRNGYISEFYYAVSGMGRGITVTDSLISACRYGVNFDFPAPGDATLDRFVGDQAGNGFRRLVVARNEFHSIALAMVRNRGDIGGTAQAANAKCVVENNKSNFGKAVFFGYLGDGSVLQGNVVQNAGNVQAAYVLDGGTNWVMANNSVYSDRTVGGFGQPSAFIQMTGEHDGFIIDGFRGEGCTGLNTDLSSTGGIDMRSGDFKGILRAIDLREIGTDGPSTRDGVFVGGTGSDTEVLVDGVTLRNAVAARSVVRMNIAGSVLKHRGIVALGAATPATSGSGTITAV